MRQFTKQVMAVMSGGALGAVCRVELSSLIMSGWGGTFPLGILCVNMTGSFFLGLLLGAASRTKHGYPTATAFLATGFFGGFTTFSSFGLDTVLLWKADHAVQALLNVGLNAGCCMALAGLGWTIAAPKKGARA